MNKNDLVYSGIGKRKTSVAKIFLKEGSGIILINNKPFEKSFLSLKEDRELLKTPLILVNLNTFYDIDIKVKGGGMSSQMDAIKLAISKASVSL
jgi:small subunit ribosomal protein S9